MIQILHKAKQSGSNISAQHYDIKRYDAITYNSIRYDTTRYDKMQTSSFHARLATPDVADRRPRCVKPGAGKMANIRCLNLRFAGYNLTVNHVNVHISYNIHRIAQLK